jgi:ferredoxin
MAIKMGRAEGIAQVVVDNDKCTACGLCVKVCKDGTLSLKDKKVVIDQTNWLGCIACGHCVAICPAGAITVNGRDLSPSDIVDLPSKELKASFEQIQALLLSRRSIREFSSKEVESEVIKKILDATSTAPMGIPPSDVGVLVFNSREKMTAFKRDVIDILKSWKKSLSPFMLSIMGIFMGRETIDMMRTFVLPLVNAIVEEDEKGNDFLFYDAPLGMYFYASVSSDSADPVIASTYAMLVAESLGLGSCMIGTVPPSFNQSKKLREKYGIPPKSHQGMMVIFGYPNIHFKKAIKRRFADVKFV